MKKDDSTEKLTQHEFK